MLLKVIIENYCSQLLFTLGVGSLDRKIIWHVFGFLWYRVSTVDETIDFVDVFIVFIVFTEFMTEVCIACVCV